MRARRLVPGLAPLAILACATVATFDGVDEVGNDKTGDVVDGLQEGWWRYYHPASAAGGTRRLQAEGLYDADRRVGPWAYWHANGNKELEGRFRDHRRDGFRTYWFASGRVRARGAFDLGLEDGPWRFYSESGSPKQSGVYAGGKAVLRWTDWDEDGRRRAEGFYLADERIGPWRFWDASGNETSDRPVGGRQDPRRAAVPDLPPRLSVAEMEGCRRRRGQHAVRRNRSDRRSPS